ncbi:MAG: hypothetical protein U9R21_08740 [Candidatus Thermoplasmatota archaeon]|nr:hypothetical protein [Candidatus Thermoplasmatota archaeon]
MKERLQYRKVTNLEYAHSSGQLKMNLEGIKDNYFSQANKLNLNAESKDFKNIHKLKISKDTVNIVFLKPTECNLETGRYGSEMLCNVKIEGNDPFVYVEKLPGLKERLSMTD